MQGLLSFVAVAATVLASSPGYVTFPIRKVSNSRKETILASAAKPIVGPGSLENTFEQYITSIEIGTPPQTLEVSIDTGSSDLWVYGGGNTTIFNTSESSTLEYVSSDFSIRYADGSSAEGNYYTDEIEWGSTKVRAQFAVDNQTFNDFPPQGTFGIGFKTLEFHGHYNNYPYVLKDDGLINSVSYSLYLDDVSSETGTLVFGALDISRYTGPLGVVPIVSDTRLEANVSVGGYNFIGLLDSGTTLTYLPNALLTTIAESLGAVYDSEYGAYKAPAILPDLGVTYDFSGTKITVPKSELWYPLSPDGELWLTIFSIGDDPDFAILGDTFLRSAYVVYDLENKTIGIAQANWNSTAEPQYKVIGSEGIQA